jgi:hypothetical protein
LTKFVNFDEVVILAVPKGMKDGDEATGGLVNFKNGKPYLNLATLI